MGRGWELLAARTRAVAESLRSDRGKIIAASIAFGILAGLFNVVSQPDRAHRSRTLESGSLLAPPSETDFDAIVGDPGAPPPVALPLGEAGGSSAGPVAPPQPQPRPPTIPPNEPPPSTPPPSPPWKLPVLPPLPPPPPLLLSVLGIGR